MRRALPLLLGMTLGLRPAAAPGYVRMTTPEGVPLRWTQGCVLLSPSERGGPGLGAAEVFQALQRSTETWNRQGGACSALRLAARAPGPRRAAADGVGALLFVTGRWGRGQVEYDPSAAALTTVAFQSRPGQPEDGAISDADIELNAVNYAFAVLDPTDPAAAPQPGPGQRLADLENTLTHELGHALGLGHNCWDRQSPIPPLTDEGKPAPDCRGALPEALRRQAMFPYAAEGEVSKRVLGSDDVAGLCGAYPIERALAPCEQTVEGGCAVSGAGAAGGVGLGAAAGLGAALRGRRRRRYS